MDEFPKIEISESLTEAIAKHQRIILTHNGVEVAAIVAHEELEFYESLEDELDMRLIRQSDDEIGETIDYETLRRELFGDEYAEE